METKRVELIGAIEKQMNHAIEMFYQEISLAFAPLGAFCAAERKRYEPLIQRTENLRKVFGGLTERIGSDEQ